MSESKLSVKLVEHTPNPERTVASAARLCYSPVGADKLVEEMTDDEVKHLLDIILNNGHLSTLEHISFTFAVEGISRVTSHQLVRHRIASYSQQSQRYVREQDQFDYVVPEQIKESKSVTMKNMYKSVLENSFVRYMTLTERLMNEGYDEKEAIEAARYVLPNAAETKIVITMNARSLLHFFELRCCNRAQQEIRQMAKEMLAKVREVAPQIFAKAGPTCVTKGRCEEGKMSCGRINEIEEGN